MMSMPKVMTDVTEVMTMEGMLILHISPIIAPSGRKPLRLIESSGFFFTQR